MSMTTGCNTNSPRLIVAGLRGGSGKTTITLGLIGAISRNMKVTPYKKGPDYIDPGWMSAAAGSPCYNLDPYMIGGTNVIRSFLSHFKGDIAIIEGNRGLYDGMDEEGSYSTAELAKLLKSPVLLVIDCTKITRTAAALVLGCMRMDESVQISGVVLNQVSSSRHEGIISRSIERYCGIPVLGAMPRLKEEELPERHMGLVPIYEHPMTINALEVLTERAVEHLDVRALVEISSKAEGLKWIPEEHNPAPCKTPVVRIGIIRDEAFQFYYPENIEELQREGAEIVYINALTDADMPDIHALYIGGGFPETNAIALAENKRFRDSVRDAIEGGLPVYAECGGLMFLGKGIAIGGREYEMAGVFPLNFKMNNRPQAHGYTEAVITDPNPFYPIGTVIRGHEFHYSSVTGSLSDMILAFTMKRGTGITNRRDGVIYKNCLAAYTHVHALGCKQWAVGLVKKALEYKNGR